MLFLRQSLTLVLALAFLTAGAAASPFSSLLVFGDSLSDVGNLQSTTFGLFPGAGYFDGRLSNGPVYAEHLAAGLGLGPLTSISDGGTNYAFAGAQTSGTGDPEGAVIRDIDEQVDSFTASQSVPSGSLVLVYAGANDLFNGQTDVSIPVNQLHSDIERLVAAGGETFLIPNLPRLGDTPRFNASSSSRTMYNQLTDQFNAHLAQAVAGLQSLHPEAIFLQLDVARLFGELVADPAPHGLTNVTDQGAAGLELGQLFYDQSNVAENIDEYLFWDAVHPTATGHHLLAQHALDLVALPGDFNRDGAVDATDYTVWRNQLGAHLPTGTGPDGNGDGMVDHLDYQIWKSFFGQTSSPALALLPSAVPPGAVPEPSGWVVALGLTTAAAALRYRHLRPSA